MIEYFLIGDILKNKSKLNQSKILSSICVTVISVVVLNIFAQLIVNNFQAKLKEQYRTNCQNIVEGYSDQLEMCIRNTCEKINYLEANRQLGDISEKQVIEYIYTLGDKKENIFNNIYYVNPNGQAFTQSKISFDVSQRDYFKNAASFKGDYIISDPVESNITKDWVVVVANPIYSSSREFRGLICCSIAVEKLSEIFKDIRLPEETAMSLMDSQGRFMINQGHPESFMKNFVPETEDLKKFSSEFVAKNKKGFIQTEWGHDEPIDLIYTVVEGTPWVFSVIVSRRQIEEIGFITRISKLFLFCLIVVFALVLMIVDNLLFNHFQKRRLLASYYDNLTNLWTRQKFEKECSILLENNMNKNFLMIEADIRGFKFINENHGGVAADKLLYYFSEILNIFARKYKGLIARGYADHFYLFFESQPKDQALEHIKSSLLHLNEMVKQYELPFTPKLGLAFYDGTRDNDTIQGLIGKASFARSTIRDNAMDQYAIYDEELLKIVKEERFLEQNMEKALENKEFFVQYQPKIDLSTEKVVGAEALVRWRNPKLGILPPNKFIPLFERNRFVKKLDFYVYECVFQFIQKQLRNGKPMVPISVNMSRIHTKPETFIREFMDVFSKYDVDPKYVEVEIIERSVVEDDTLLRITDLLHEKGFKVAMDDFGSGESSLNMLTKIPVDVLKFDREFLMNSSNEAGGFDEKNQNFIKTLIDLSKNLEKQTIFEGVETKLQRDFLKQIHCDQVQGFFYSKPLLEEDFLKFLDQHM